MYELKDKDGNIVKIKAISLKKLAEQIEGKWYHHEAYRVLGKKRHLILLPKVKYE